MTPKPKVGRPRVTFALPALQIGTELVRVRLHRGVLQFRARYSRAYHTLSLLQAWQVASNEPVVQPVTQELLRLKK